METITKSLSYTVSSQVIRGVACIVAAPTSAEREEQERTRINKKLFLEILERTYGNVSAACQRTDIARSTIYNWLQVDPAFRKAVNIATRVRVDVAEDKLFSIGMAGEGDVGALKFLLKHNHHKYKRQRKGPTEVNIHHHRAWESKNYDKSAPTLEDLLAADDAKEDARETPIPLDKPIQEIVRRNESEDEHPE